MVGAGRHPRDRQADFLVATFFDDPLSDFLGLDPPSDFELDVESELVDSELLDSELLDSEDEIDDELSDFSLLRRDELGLSVL